MEQSRLWRFKSYSFEGGGGYFLSNLIVLVMVPFSGLESLDWGGGEFVGRFAAAERGVLEAAKLTLADQNHG